MAKKNKSTDISGGGMREDGSYISSKNVEYDYVLRYISESIDSITPVIAATARAIEAYKGNPSKDHYLASVQRYADSYLNVDDDKRKSLVTKCKNVHPRKSTVIMQAVDTMVAQAMGGIGQYECEPWNPYLSKDAAIIEKLKLAAKNMWLDQHVDALLPQLIEYAALGGAAYVHIGYKQNTSKDDGDFDLQVVPLSEMLIDPIRSKRNRERYIGYKTTKSWKELRKYISQCEKTGSWILESVNNVDTYLQEVTFWINKYHGNFEAMYRRGGGPENLPFGIDTFYKASSQAWLLRNTEYIDWAGGSEGREDNKYVADDVEVCYLYDLENHIKFTVVNRRYIIAADKSYLTGEIDYTMPIVDLFTGEATEEIGTFKVTCDHPFACLEYKRSLWETYAYSPIVHILDIFDDICALESLIYHTVAIMTPITFTGNPADIEKVGLIAGVSGETIKGFIANSVTVLNKATDLSPAIMEITRLEQRVRSVMNGTDAAEAAQMLGDRASGTEAALNATMITQGLNPIIARIEKFASDLANKFFKLKTIYEDAGWMYQFSNDGKPVILSKQEIAGELNFRAILKNRIKIEARQEAANTIQWFMPLMGAVPNPENLAKSVVPHLAEGFSAADIASWFEKTEQQQLAESQQAEMNSLKLEQARNAVTADSPLDPSYVNPYGSEGQFGQADVMRALSGGAETGEMGDSEPAPQTARQLSTGVNQGDMPMVDVPQVGTTGPDMPTNREVKRGMQLEATADPSFSGINANEPISGENQATLNEIM
jgi:hypothetical protein